MSLDAIDNALDVGANANDGANTPTNDAPQPEYVPKTELDAVTERLSAQEKRMQDVARFMGGGNNQPDPEAVKANLLNQLVTDPQSYGASLVEEAEARAVARMQVENIKTKFRADNPKLEPFIDQIESGAYAIAEKWTREGKLFSPQEALKESAKDFTERLQKWNSATTQETKGQELKTQSLKFELGNGGAPKEVTMSEVLESVKRGDIKYEDVRAKLAKVQGLQLPY